MKLPDVNLSKWPGLLVTGQPVTKKQAQKINIRTSSLPYLSTNNKAFHKKVLAHLFDGLEDYYEVCRTDKDTEFESGYGILNLNYLTNKNIASAFVGGPHGWCDWKGNIRASSYNIGKWPSVKAVYGDWSLIAETFSYLNLKCQLLDGETCEIESRELKPLIQFDVKDGVVTVVEDPQELIIQPEPFDKYYLIKLFSNDDNRELGLTFEELVTALEVTKLVLHAKDPTLNKVSDEAV